MVSLALALALVSTATPEGLLTRLPPAPLSLYRVAWRRPLVAPQPGDMRPLEEGGATVDPASGLVVCGTRDGWLHALRPDGTRAWEFQAGGAFPAPPTVEGDTVYAGSSDGRLYALSLADGKQRWRYEAGEEVGGRPLVVGGTVFVATLQDTLFAVDARTGAWKWHHRREVRGIDRGFTIRGVAAPAELGGTVFAAYADGFVSALDAATGQVRWERSVAPTGDYVDVDGLALDGGRLYAAAYSGALLALDVRTGAQVWSFRAPAMSRVTAGKGLVVAETASQLYGLAPGTGQVIWSTPLDGAPGAPPVFAGSWLLVPAADGGLRFVEPASGRTLRVFDAGSGVSGAPGVGSGHVYVLSNGGVLYALDLK